MVACGFFTSPVILKVLTSVNEHHLSRTELL
jgi:hypothetical protein